MWVTVHVGVGGWIAAAAAAAAAQNNMGWFVLPVSTLQMPAGGMATNTA
jgi:hypothetical protein